MKADLKAKWIAALRSGDYKQTTNDLWTYYPDTGMSYCCLGILQLTADIPFKHTHKTDPEGDTADETRNALLRDSVAKKVGLPLTRSQMYDDLSDNNLQKRLAELNKDHNFNQIADWIEANVPVDAD